MIQRIQSIFLFISAVVLTLVLFLPIWTSSTTGTYDMILDGFSLKMKDLQGNILKSETTIFIIGLASLGILNSLYAIFKFRKRLVQIKLGYVTILINLFIIASFIYSIKMGQELLGNDQWGTFQFGFFMPIISIVCILLANHYIQKDEKLVRSVDRLR
jgi:hypothetical protein